MISVSNVSMRYGAKVLFDEVSTGFTPGKRYGLTGPNGAGKSTFMKLLSGELEPQKGTVVRPEKLGILSQDQFAFDQYRVIDTVIMGNKRLWAALEERDQLYSKTERWPSCRVVRKFACYWRRRFLDIRWPCCSTNLPIIWTWIRSIGYRAF